VVTWGLGRERLVTSDVVGGTSVNTRVVSSTRIVVVVGGSVVVVVGGGGEGVLVGSGSMGGAE